MLTFRKSVIAAIILLGFVFLLRSSHSSKSPILDRPLRADKATPNGDTVVPESGATQQQQTLESRPLAPLRERLRYQFPYDLRSNFPAYIWQTWKYTPSSVWFDPELRTAEASWTEKHPDFVHQVVPDDTQRHLIKYLYASVPEVYEAFEAMPMAVLKADFFRYLILLARGGIYSDIDTTAIQPASDWLPPELDRSTVGFVIGIEADPDRPDWHDWYSRRIQFCQWTIQSKPGHPILRDLVATITEDALRMKKKGLMTNGRTDKTIVEFTGPGVWTDAVFRYFNNPDYFIIPPGDDTRNITYEDFSNQREHRKVGDVVVLPITSFSPGVQQMGAEDVDDPMAFVEHNFGGMFPSLNNYSDGSDIKLFRYMEDRSVVIAWGGDDLRRYTESSGFRRCRTVLVYCIHLIDQMSDRVAVDILHARLRSALVFMPDGRLLVPWRFIPDSCLNLDRVYIFIYNGW